MASSYDNNLRLDELATGDGSGTWGTTTNTNLTLIADALGYQSFAVASESTDTLTIPNGTETDNEAISLYIKLTGGNQACTITVGPNTVKKLWIIENSTSQVITLTQGSGANVILAAGVTKMIYADGAGSGAALTDALVGLEVGTTFYIKNAATGDDSTAQLFLQTAEADIQANDVLGKINFQAPNEGTGTDAILVAAAIQAKSEGDFSSSSNATSLEFMTGASEAAATKMTLSSGGNLDVTGDITGSTLNADGDTSADDNAAIGYTSAEGLILTGQGSTGDVTIKNDADAVVLQVPTGTTNVNVIGSLDVATNAVIDGTALVTGVLTTTATQVATGGITSGSNIVSDTDSTDDLGATGARWANLFVDAITATDQITATGFTGTLDGILGSGTAAAATVTTLNTSDAVNLNLVTDSSSSTSGALIVDGGVGIAKKLFVGTDLDVSNNAVIDNTALVTGVLTTTAATVFNGGFVANDGSTITTADNTTQLTLASTDTDANVGPVLDLNRNVTGADDDNLGSIIFKGKDDAGNAQNFAKIDTSIRDASNSTEAGRLNFYVANSGSETKFLSMIGQTASAGASITFNEDHADVDFRVEGDTLPNLFHIDAGDDSIGINSEGTGDALLTIKGPSGADGSTITTKTLEIIEGGFNDGITFQVGDSSGNSRFHVDGAGNVVINEVGADVDFRVESDTLSHAIFLDSSANDIMFGNSSANAGGHAWRLNGDPNYYFAANNSSDANQPPVFINRQASDGALIHFRQANSEEGSISVSGNTVSYNGFAGRHESSGIATDTPKGTVVSTIDELDVRPSKKWDETTSTLIDNPIAGQTRADHAKVKISDSTEDKRVYGVVDDFENTGKVNIISVGIASIRVTGACAGGDLLESNGDGTAKVQSDDIVRSKTLGKVTIGNSNTDVKLVSCVIYCG